MEFNWYTILSSEIPISQGDIILKCILPGTVYDKEKKGFFKQQGAILDVIVMTQACDLENSKVDHVTLCPLKPLREVVKEMLLKIYPTGENHQKVLDDDIKGRIKDNKVKIINELRNGSYLDFHVLNKFDKSEDVEELDYMVVLLRQSYTLPIESLQAQLEANNKDRISLLPPYREHLSQAYARNFFRIGLPIDIRIDHTEI
ncbi:hypothetical protein ABEO51_08125 [Bacillus safensis]